jgi:hypothetical protein
MKNSQVINILGVLSKKEHRELRKWLISPVHNQRSDVVQLYEYLLAPGRLEDDKALEKERIFKKLYPKEAYSDLQMRQVIHFLREAIEGYLMHSKAREDRLTQLLVLAKIYRERKLSRLYERTMKRLDEEYQNITYRNEEVLERSYLIEKEKSNSFVERSRALETNYQAMSDSMELTFMSRKLKLACAMLSHQRIYKTQYDFGLLEKALEHLQTNSRLLSDPNLKLYFHLYNLFKFPDEEFHFFEIKEVLASSEHFFDAMERKDIYLMVINYCIGRMNIGKMEFVREAFVMYQLSLEKGIMFESGILSHLNFRNIVTAGTSLKEFDWVSQFIENYQQYLAPEYRENFVQFSWAKLYFEQGDYDKAQHMLIQFDIDDVLINLSAKSMLIRIYYEEGELSTLESLLESLRTYINRKKMLAYHKIIYNNLIRFTKKLIKLPPRNKPLKARLRKQIEEANPLPERKWLLEQLDKL